MKTYILLLRGINVSGQKIIKMAALKELLEKLAIQNVQTYIQSGNIIFSSEETSKTSLEKTIEHLIFETYKFEVPALVFEAKEFELIIENSPYLGSEIIDANHSYFVLLKAAADASLSKALNTETYSNEEFVITSKCIYLNCKMGYGKAKCTNNFFERKLKLEATTRNYKTMSKLVELSRVIN
jgi:uncharacterized protein (DUF1697 family)